MWNVCENFIVLYQTMQEHIAYHTLPSRTLPRSDQML